MQYIRGGLPSDASVAQRHAELPGLTLLLDPAALVTAVEPLGGGPYALERLRLKPGASVTAILRAKRGSTRLIARALAPQLWETKRHKDVRAAQRRGLDSLELPDAQLIVTPAAADRHLPGLWAVRPDTGVEICVDAGPAGQAVTLSHNPARRWVGRLDRAAGAPLLLRLHGAAPVSVHPWAPGRGWRAGDPMPAEGLWAACLSDVVEGHKPLSRLPVEPLHSAVEGLGAVHGPWAERARVVVAHITPRLAGTALAPGHGDLSADQLVVDDADRSVTVLDWDRAGWWPVGWDAASWVASRVRDGASPEAAAGEAAPLGRPTAAVLAAAAILRSPEPFRRRHPEWAAATDRLLSYAEAVAS